MANDKDFKVKNSIQATGYLEGIGTISTGSTSWDIEGAFYDDISFSVASEEATPYGLWFKTDGTKMYVIGVSGDAVVEYDLSTAWDISTSSYNQEFSVSSQEGAPTGVAFKSDGTKMYIIGLNNDSVYQYALSTAWDVSTASYENKSFSTQTQIAYPMGLYFTSDGTKFYTCGYNSDDAAQYTLSTAWDVSTASHTNTLDLATDEATLRGVALKPDGTKFYTIGSTTDTVRQYSLSTAYDLSTASYDDINFSVNAQQANPFGIFFKSDGTKFYITGNTGDSVYQYSLSTTLKTLDLSTGSVFELTPANRDKISISNPAASGTVSQATLLLEGAGNGFADITTEWTYTGKTLSLASEETTPRDIFFKSDGLTLFTIGNAGDTIDTYTLSTAWDITTATFSNKQLSTAGQSSTPRGFYFKSDGTKVYITGSSGDSVWQYSLSTAWDVSTGSYDSVTLSVSGQETGPSDIFFKPDGTQMFILGTTGKDINVYNLSTAWDLSTASYSTVSSSLNSYETNPNGMFFKSDGLKLYIVGGDDEVNEFSLSTAWDVSTISHVGAYSVVNQETNSSGITFKPDGTKMYVVGTTTDTIYQYSTASAYTVSYDSSIKFAGGTAPTARSEGLSVLTFSTRDYGTSYQAVLALDGAI